MNSPVNNDEAQLENSKIKLLESKIISVNGKSSELFNSSDGFYIELKKEAVTIEL